MCILDVAESTAQKSKGVTTQKIAMFKRITIPMAARFHDEGKLKLVGRVWHDSQKTTACSIVSNVFEVN